jgi:hypothetical protein
LLARYRGSPGRPRAWVAVAVKTTEAPGRSRGSARAKVKNTPLRFTAMRRSKKALSVWAIGGHSDVPALANSTSIPP